VLTFSPGNDWPSGTATLVLRLGSNPPLNYTMEFDGTETVRVVVDDMWNGIAASCVGSLLEPYDATCV